MHLFMLIVCAVAYETIACWGLIKEMCAEDEL